MLNLHSMQTSLILSSACKWMHRNMLSLCVNFYFYDIDRIAVHPLENLSGHTHFATTYIYLVYIYYESYCSFRTWKEWTPQVFYLKICTLKNTFGSSRLLD